MKKLTRSDILSLERYAAERSGFRSRVIAHKKARSIALGRHATLLFEDRLTVQYQVQEILRIERIFEAGAIQEELDAYNPLIPDGNNLKATMLLEVPDASSRVERLSRLQPDVAARVPQHRQLIAFRNVLVHGYAGLNDDEVWRVLHKNLPKLLIAVTALLAELGGPGQPIEPS